MNNWKWSVIVSVILAVFLAYFISRSERLSDELKRKDMLVSYYGRENVEMLETIARVREVSLAGMREYHRYDNDRLSNMKDEAKLNESEREVEFLSDNIAHIRSIVK